MRKSLTEKCRQQGFSLLEMLVATAILGMVGLLIGSTVYSFQRSYVQAQKISAGLMRNQAIDRLVEGYFAAAVPFIWEDEDDNDSEKYVFQGEPDELYLTALRRAYRGDKGALRFVRIYCEDDKLKCDYSYSPLLPWKDLQDQKYETEVIAEGVRAISFLYAELDDDEGIEWLDVWPEEEHNGIPLAIQITVEFTDGSKERWLRRTAGNSEYSSFGFREGPST